REITDPPSVLYAKGAWPPPDLPLIAVVGTRKATKEGLNIAKDFARDLARSGCGIVSGLAMGIDTAAHRGALAAGGFTAAVLGNGIDVVYPAQNEKLAADILNTKGLIISEYGPGEPSYPGNFLRRNRIISGLSVATLVIEAPAQSGALATARFAAEQGREVFVVPGSLSNRNYRGSHELIRDGATLVQGVEDVLGDLGQNSLFTPHSSNLISPELSEEETIIVETLRKEGSPLGVDRLLELTKLEPRTVSIGLTSLTLKGYLIEERSVYSLKIL
ncbi:MAG: DNA protecting protein DprA, partial [Candidatus Colwellbacteria bacterium RBG_13_48_8]